MRRHCRTDDHPRTNPPPATTRRRHTTRTRTVRPRAHHHEDKVDKSTVYGALSAPITPPPQAKAARWRVSMRLLTTTIHLVTNPAGPDTTNSPSGTRPRPARNPTNWTPMRRHSRTTAHSVRVPTGGTTSLRRRLGPPVAPPGVLLHRKPADPEDARTWGVGRRAHDLDDGIAKSTVYGALSAPILLAPVTSAVMWTPVRRHCRTTAHSVKVSARQGVPGTEGSSGAAGFDGTEGFDEDDPIRRARRLLNRRTTHFAAHGGPCTGRRPPPHPQSYPQILWICRWTTPCPCADAPPGLCTPAWSQKSQICNSSDRGVSAPQVP